MNRLSVAIILLLSLIPPYVVQVRRQHKLDRCWNNLYQITYSLEAYAKEHDGRYPPSLADLVQTGHLPSLPNCPALGCDNYSATYTVSGRARECSFGCAGRQHGEPSGADTFDAWCDRKHCSPRGFPWFKLPGV